MRKVRILALIVAMMVITGVLQAQDEIVIDFYFPQAVDGPIAEAMDRYAAEFMEANPGIVINSVYTGSYNQTRDTVLAEGDDLIVDVAVMLAIDLLSFVEAGTITPVQPYIDAMDDGEAYVADIYPAFLANGTGPDGQIWTVPFQRSTPIMYYNADLLAAEGFEVPTNNEDLIEVAQALTTEDRFGLLVPVAGIFPSWMFQSFAAAYGQPVTVQGEPDQVYLDTPEALAAVEFVTRLGMPVEDGGFGVGPMGGSAWGDTPTAFIGEQAAMIYHSTGSLTSILANAPFEVGVAFLPSGPAGEDGTGYGSPTGGGNLYLFNDGNKSQEELDAAWAWINFLSQPEIQADWGATTGYIAAFDSAWQTEPLASLVEEFPQYGVTRDHLSVASQEFSAFRTIDLQNIVNGQLARIISGEVPLEEAGTVLAEAQAQIDDLLADYR